MAQEDNEFSDEDDDDAEPGFRHNQEKQFYEKGELERKTKGLDLDSMAERYKETVQEDNSDLDQELSEEDQQMYDEDERQNLLPSVKDPSLWQVRVKRGSEKMAVLALMNKAIDFASRGSPLSILSATCVDTVEGFIYVEAFKQIHVN